MNPNTIPNKRKLAAAVDKVVRSNVLTAEDFAGACNALAQVFMDTFQVEASVKLEIKGHSISAARAIYSTPEETPTDVKRAMQREKKERWSGAPCTECQQREGHLMSCKTGWS